MASKIPAQIVPSLYRTMLKLARDYGKAAERKKRPALDEICSFNNALNVYKIKPRNSLHRGIMTPSLAQFIVRLVFKKKEPQQNSNYLLDDAFAALKKLHQRVATLGQFPNISEREDMINGMKVEAKCRFVAAGPAGTQKTNYHYQIYLKFTNCTPQSVQLLNANILTKDETLHEIKSDRPLPQSPCLLSSGTYEHRTSLAISTESGTCACEYSFVNVQTGTRFTVLLPPLLLSTHDPDMAHREAPYRGDPNVDIQVEIQSYPAQQHVMERSPSKKDDGEKKMKMWLNADVRALTTHIRTGPSQRQSLNSLDFDKLDRDESHEEIGAKSTN